VRVCPRHGLVAGPNGRCVICQRTEGDRGSPDAARGAVGLLLLALVMIGGALVWKGATGAAVKPAEIVHGDGTAVAPPPPIEEADPAVADDARKARHEAERKADEQRNIEDEMRKVKVRVYTAKVCDLCDLARKYLVEKGMTFVEIDVGNDAAALDAMHRLTPSNEVPVFDIEGEVLVGFGPTNVAAAVRRAADRHVHARF
jgi:glutaredoxin